MKINNNKRIFIGIPIGCKIRPILPVVRHTINCNSQYIKWISSENVHLTLYFLGNVINSNIPFIVRLLKNKIQTKDFSITIQGTGVFPSSMSPKLLWLGIERGLDKLTSLQHQVEKTIRKFINNYQEITFSPHITIARIRKLNGKIDVLPFLNTVYSPLELDVNSLCLYESELLPNGARYSVLHTFPLN